MYDTINLIVSSLILWKVWILKNEHDYFFLVVDLYKAKMVQQKKNDFYNQILMLTSGVYADVGMLNL